MDIQCWRRRSCMMPHRSQIHGTVCHVIEIEYDLSRMLHIDWMNDSMPNGTNQYNI